jgi:hypothetical protein
MYSSANPSRSICEGEYSNKTLSIAIFVAKSSGVVTSLKRTDGGRLGFLVNGFFWYSRIARAEIVVRFPFVNPRGGKATRRSGWTLLRTKDEASGMVMDLTVLMATWGSNSCISTHEIYELVTTYNAIPKRNEVVG